jgi:hypothetical protein
MNSKQTNNTWIIENEKIIKKLQKTKMVQHHIASNNEKQEPRINHQAIRRSFVQVPTCLVLCFVLLVFKLSLATLCSKPSKSSRFLWSLVLFQLLGSCEGEWWRKNEGLWCGYEISKKMKKGRKVRVFCSCLILIFCFYPLWAAQQLLCRYL